MNRKAQRIANDAILRLYRERLINIALAQFEWHGLPDTVNPLYLEKVLLETGVAAVYKEEVSGLWLGTSFFTKPSGGRIYDVYGNPLSIDGLGANGERLGVDRFYVLYDNRTKLSLMGKINTYAELLADIHGALISNLSYQKIPLLIPTDSKTRLTMDNLALQRSENIPVIKYDKSLNLEDVKPFRLDVPFLGNQLLDMLKGVWAEALSMLGITPVTTKKERLIQDEISANRQGDVVALNGRLLNRIELCNKLNKLEGLDVSVNLSSVDTEYDFGGGGMNGEIYDNPIRNSEEA